MNNLADCSLLRIKRKKRPLNWTSNSPFFHFMNSPHAEGPLCRLPGLKWPPRHLRGQRESPFSWFWENGVRVPSTRTMRCRAEDREATVGSEDRESPFHRSLAGAS